MEEAQKKLKPTLIKKSSSYKMIIPKEVEDKIRFICSKVWNTEWSGTLFYTYEGSFEENNLVIKCVDLYVMDIGNAVYTEFDMSPKVIAYMTENPELLDCQIGLIHSHNNMPSFFSNTDTDTLIDEGQDRNNFVSLIVNNAGTYTAAITRKMVTSMKVEKHSSYNFFDRGNILDSSNEVEEKEEITIEYFYLDIEKEGCIVYYDSIQNTLDEIRKEKEDKIKKANTSSITKNNYFNSNSPFIKNNNYNAKVNNKPSQKYLPFEDYNDDYNDYKAWNKSLDINSDVYAMDYELDKVKLNPKTIKSFVAQIISGCILVNPDKIDIEKFASSITKVYDKRFGTEGKGYKAFMMWADAFCEYLVWNNNSTELITQGYDETEECAIIANNIIEELKKLPSNIYIEGYIETLEKYIEL